MSGRTRAGSPVAPGQPDAGRVASDVAKVLGYSNPRDAIAKHCKGRRETRLPSAGGPQTVTVIPERDAIVKHCADLTQCFGG